MLDNIIATWINSIEINSAVTQIPGQKNLMKNDEEDKLLPDPDENSGQDILSINWFEYFLPSL